MARIETTYKKDGSLIREPKGFGGTLCHQATKPYEHRQGQTRKFDTPEANEPSYLEVEKTSQPERLTE